VIDSTLEGLIQGVTLHPRLTWEAPAQAELRRPTCAGASGRRHADVPLRHADAEFLQSTVKGAPAKSEVFGSELGISAMPREGTVDQEKFSRFKV